jgi:sterol desaturase/sphingolipid hydroxylase (fatty acid hydroxylase superfamily)
MHAVATSVVSTGLVFAVVLGLAPVLFAAAPVGPLRAVGEAAAILVLYDFAYYFFHRFALHTWSVGRRIHALHHSIRTPYARDSLYVHPAETAGGVLLFLGASLLVGPVGVASFGLAFLVYSLLNIWNHSAIDLPALAMRPFSALVRHHDIHHESMRSGYFGSIFPVWDLAFGTARGTAEMDALAAPAAEPPR